MYMVYEEEKREMCQNDYRCVLPATQNSAEKRDAATSPMPEMRPRCDGVSRSLQGLRWEGFSTQTAENRKNGQKPFPNSVAKINHENPPYNRNTPLLEKHNFIVMIMDISPKEFEVLRMFYGPIVEQENAGLPQPLAESTISEAIKTFLRSFGR